MIIGRRKGRLIIVRAYEFAGNPLFSGEAYDGKAAPGHPWGDPVRYRLGNGHYTTDQRFAPATSAGLESLFCANYGQAFQVPYPMSAGPKPKGS